MRDIRNISGLVYGEIIASSLPKVPKKVALQSYFDHSSPKTEEPDPIKHPTCAISSSKVTKALSKTKSSLGCTQKGS